MKNLHITLAPFKNASRILKQTKSLLDSETFDEVFILALWEQGFHEYEELSSGAKVKRLKLKSRGLPTSLPFQIIKYLEFMFKCLICIKKLKVAVVNCHSLALLPLGVMSKLCFGTKLVYDAHELETERNGLTGVRKSISKIVEKFLITKVDLTIVVGDKIADHYVESYPIEKPTVVLNTPYRKYVEKNDLIRQELGILKDDEIYLYQGKLTAGRGIELLLAAFSSNKIASKKVLVFMGYGSLDKLILDYADKNDNIFLLDAVSPDVVLSYTASADFGFSLIEPVCLSYEYCLPNKLFEYMMAGIPVIASNLPEMKSVIEKTNSGYILDDYSVNALLSLINRTSSFELKQSLLDFYSWNYQEQVMLDSYKDKIL